MFRFETKSLFFRYRIYTAHLYLFIYACIYTYKYIYKLYIYLYIYTYLYITHIYNLYMRIYTARIPNTAHLLQCFAKVNINYSNE